MRRKWVIALAVLATPMLPPAAGYLHNEAVIDDTRDQLEMMLGAR